MRSMNQSTIQREVVESVNDALLIELQLVKPDVPLWALQAELSHGKVSTHISSQEERHEDPPEWLQGKAVVQAPFTCNECPSKWMEKVHWGEIPEFDANGKRPKANWRYTFMLYKVKRCSPCNIKYKRWQRVRRAFKWLGDICKDKKCRPKFLTITKTLRTSSSPFTKEMIEADRATMCKEFRMTRKSKAWPNKYAGIWVYEAKVRAPGDEIKARWPDENGHHPVIRVAKQFELHGHIHAALATRYIRREPLLERHEGVHVKASGVEHMKKYLMGYMLVDTVGRYNRIGGEKTWE